MKLLARIPPLISPRSVLRLPVPLELLKLLPLPPWAGCRLIESHSFDGLFRDCSLVKMRREEEEEMWMSRRRKREVKEMI